MTNETKPVLLTEAEARELLTRPDSEAEAWIATLRERGLIAPAPVDPLLIEAREICAKQAESNDLSGWAKECRAGKHDDDDEVECALAALRRGMELAKPELTWERVREAVPQAHRALGMPTMNINESFVTALHAALQEQSK